MELLEDELIDEEDDLPSWVGSDRKVNEVMYCMCFLEKHPMKCIGKRFFTVDGLVEDEESIKAMMFEDFQPHIYRDIAKMVPALCLPRTTELPCTRTVLPTG